MINKKYKTVYIFYKFKNIRNILVNFLNKTTEKQMEYDISLCFYKFKCIDDNEDILW